MATKKKETEVKLFKTKTIIEPAWEKVPIGTKFTGTINDKKCSGRIQKEGGSIYLCQSEVNGDECTNRLGYKFSWFLDDACEIHTLELDPEFVAPKVIRIGDKTVEFGAKFIAVGCTKVSFTKVLEVAEEVKKRMKKAK